MLRLRNNLGRVRLAEGAGREEILKQCSRGLLREEGSALVEMAICSVVVLGLILGIIQASWAFYTRQYLAEASREAARYAMTRGSTSCTNTPTLTDCDAEPAAITAFVQGLGYPGIVTTVPPLGVTTTWLAFSGTQPATWTSCAPVRCNQPGNQVSVQVTYGFPYIIPFMANSTLNMSSTSTMVISQ